MYEFYVYFCVYFLYICLSYPLEKNVIEFFLKKSKKKRIEAWNVWIWLWWPTGNGHVSQKWVGYGGTHETDDHG